MNTSRGYPIGRAGTMALAVWSLLLLGGFALARSLEPDPRGYGTHQRLGLPPCTFQTVFGVRCPSCGMTTSFACFTRGQLSRSVAANGGGTLLAITCALQIPWCWVSIFSRRLLWVSQPEAALFWLLIVLSGACLLDWIVRLL